MILLDINMPEMNGYEFCEYLKADGRMSGDLKAAAKIQETFLPREVAPVPGADFAWIYRPCAELAGDGLNVVPLGRGKVGLYILDVSGHGVASALRSVTLSRLLSPPSDPSSILIRGVTYRAVPASRRPQRSPPG